MIVVYVCFCLFRIGRFTWLLAGCFLVYCCVVTLWVWCFSSFLCVLLFRFYLVSLLAFALFMFCDVCSGVFVGLLFVLFTVVLLVYVSVCVCLLFACVICLRVVCCLLLIVYLFRFCFIVLLYVLFGYFICTC